MTSAVRIRSGRPSDALRSDALLIHKFNSISTVIEREMMVNEKMGKSADRKMVTLVRLPQKLFRDFREEGSLNVILQIALKRMKPTAWAVYDVLEPNNWQNMFDLIGEMDRRLQEKGMLKRPVIFFSNDLSAQLMSELSAIATRHGATVVEQAEGATHIVAWDAEVDGASPEDLVDDFIRPLQLRPNQGQGVALVHWWYYPDSYDEWIPSAEVECRDLPEDPDIELPALDKQWRVSCRFVRDVAVFNEWGNELDYEKENEAEGEDGLPESSEGMGSAGRRGRGKKSRSDKQRRAERAPILEAVQATEKMMVSLPPPTDDPRFYSQAGEKGAVVVDVQDGGRFKMSVASRQQVEAADTSGGDDRERMEENEAGRTEWSDSNMARAKKRKDMDTSPSLVKTEMDDSSAGDGPLQKRKRQLLLNEGEGGGMHFPSWYCPRGISTVEMRYLPELLAPALHLEERARSDEAESAYRGDQCVPVKESSAFLGTKTCQRYIAVRNFIVDLYRENPNVYLTATECRQKMAGDAAFTMRVHEFLDTFDLINYNSATKPSFRPLKTPAFFTSCPTVREIEDHCSAFRSSSQPVSCSSVAGQGRGEDGALWNEASDGALLAAIASALTVKEGSAEKNVDWNKVSSDMANVVSWAPSAHVCFRRFVEMTLSSPAGADAADNQTTGAALDPTRVHKRVIGGGWNGMALSKKLHSAAAVVAAECASKLDYETALSAVSAANSAIKVTAVGAEAIGEVLGGGAALVSAGAKEALKGHAQAMGDVLDDYLSLRLVALEEKVKLVSEVEKCLQMERDRLELDRRDLQVQRAELAFYQPY